MDRREFFRKLTFDVPVRAGPPLHHVPIHLGQKGGLHPPITAPRNARIQRKVRRDFSAVDELGHRIVKEPVQHIEVVEGALNVVMMVVFRAET